MVRWNIFKKRPTAPSGDKEKDKNKPGEETPEVAPPSTEPTDKEGKGSAPVSGPLSGMKRRPKSVVPDGLWQKCDDCNAMVYIPDVENNALTCPECDYHFYASAWKRVELTADKGTFEEMFGNLNSSDPLHFMAYKSYREKVEEAQERTKLKEGILTGKCKMDNFPIALGVMDKEFIMGSMGTVVGEKIRRLSEFADANRMPLILFCASGGARMQEGILSLMQMAKTSAAVARFRENGGLFIAVLTHPTTAGVAASFASLGDIIISEPRTLIGFTGQRVIKQTINAELPPGFQQADFLLVHGQLDMIVHRRDMRDCLGKILAYCGYKKSEEETAKKK